MVSTTIQSISYYLPDRIYTNEEFFLDFPNAKGTSLEKVGVKERHIISPNQTSSDLAFLAAEKLFSEHKIDRNEIDFLLLAFYNPDYYLPSTSAVLQGKLGLRKDCGALDFEIGCSAYVYGLGVAAGLIAATGAKKILLLTSSSLTTTFHPKDRGSRFVFGDAAAATLISSDGKGNIGPFVFGTDGTGYDKIIIKDGGARNPISETSSIEQKDEFGNIGADENFHMDGMGVFLFSVRTVPALIEDILGKAGLKKEEIDLFIFHQPNVFLNETIRKKIGIPEEKFVHCMEKTGNTVQSTIPIAIYESQKNGRLKPGMTVVLAGFGVGLSWGATVVKF